MDAAIYSLAGLVAVLVLRPVLAQALRPGVPAAPDNMGSGGRRQGRHAAALDVEEQASPYDRLSSRITELEHSFKLLSNEWTDKESRVDSLLKRINRLRKLEGDTATEEPVQVVPLTREAVLARYQAMKGNGG